MNAILSTRDASRLVDAAASLIVRHHNIPEQDFADVRQDIFVCLLSSGPANPSDGRSRNTGFNPESGKLSSWIFSRSRAVVRNRVKHLAEKTCPLTIDNGDHTESERDELAVIDAGIGDYLTGDEFTDMVIVGLSEGRTKKDIASLAGCRVKKVEATIKTLKRRLS